MRADVVSPLELNRSLGAGQWFYLLSKPMFSTFNAVYEFVRRSPGDADFRIPSDVRSEIAVASLFYAITWGRVGQRVFTTIDCLRCIFRLWPWRDL